MQLSLADTNKRIQKVLGTTQMELVKGDGYLYFVYDDGGKGYDTRSVMVPYLKDLPLARWVDEAKDFYAACVQSTERKGN